MVRFILLFIVFFGLLNCKNYAGSSAPVLLQKVTVPVSNDLRVEPGNWWTGMQHRTVEIMVHRADVASYAVKLGPVKGIKLIKVEKADSPNYLFLTLDIAKSAKPQTVPLVFSKGTLTFTHPYPILARTGAVKAQGVNSSDAIYLIFPDRFSNGDPSNDNVAGMRQGLQRDSLVGRHGGDLQGVINHLDYLQDLGISTIWLNPELENDQKEASYHGYAVTDHYQVDKRFGSNELLKSLVQNCHQRGMKVVRDVVLNHIGGQHWWMDDLPAKDWLNQWPTFTRTTYRAPTLVDPYGSEWDKSSLPTAGLIIPCPISTSAIHMWPTTSSSKRFGGSNTPALTICGSTRTPIPIKHFAAAGARRCAMNILTWACLVKYGNTAFQYKVFLRTISPLKAHILIPIFPGLLTFSCVLRSKKP